MLADVRRYEARAPGIDMPVAGAGLLVRIEALRHDQVQFILSPRHRHIEEAPFLLDFLACAGGKVGRDAAIHHIEDRDRLPFLAFRGMDGGEDQIILIEQRLSRFVARGIVADRA